MRLFMTLSGLVVFLAGNALAENWPQWRGPDANGISPEKGVPTRWSHEKNLAWKTPLPGLGTSSPIVWGDLIFITSQLGVSPTAGRDFPGAATARKSGEENKVIFAVHAFRRRDGVLAWEYKFPAEGVLPEVHIKHNLASPSCATDGEFVYAWMGTGQLVALDMAGKLVWQRHLGKEFAPFDIRWGHGSSPAIYKNSLIVLCDHPVKAYLLALDKRTGKVLWQVDRGSDLRSYTTPYIYSGPKGDRLVINSNPRIDVFDPSTGELLWHFGEPNRVPIGMPVYDDGILYATRGHRSGPYMAVRVEGKADVSKTHMKWHVPTGAPYVPSILYYEGLIYMVSEGGVVACVDAETGTTVWKERLDGVFTASPVAAEGKIYILNEDGDAFVLRAGRTFSVLERNGLGERTLASPAISGAQLFIRSDQHLFCIGRP